jgi:hypothetical protein
VADAKLVACDGDIVVDKPEILVVSVLYVVVIPLG